MKAQTTSTGSAAPNPSSAISRGANPHLGRDPDRYPTVQSALASLAAYDIEGVRTSAAELHRRFFAPVASHLAGVRRLVLVTHGPWLNVPFQALFDPVSDTFLGETVASSQAS